VEGFFREDLIDFVSTETSKEGVARQTIKLCPTKKRSMTGWRDGKGDTRYYAFRFLKREFNSSSLFEIYESVDDKTYTLYESILTSSIIKVD